MGPVTVGARGVSKRFGAREALRDVSFGAHRGELLAIIGPNGAGKTTLLSILAGLLEPSAGTLSHRPQAVGWVPQQTAVYGKLTVRENLELFARLEKVADPRAAVDRMLEQTGLADRAGEELSRLSDGNRQRVNIAVGLLADPPVLLLDEPTAALDPRQRERLWEWVAGLARAGTSVVFSTHNVGEAERWADHLLVLADGEVVFAGTPVELAAAAGGHPPREAGMGRGSPDFEGAFVHFLRERGH